MLVIPPATSRRLALMLALLATIVTGLPAVVRLLATASRAGDLRLGSSTAARVPASWTGLAVQDISVERGPGLPSGTVRVGVVAPTSTPRADLLFFHGHSDRIDNHQALFTAWRDDGIRVISFDLPDHGGTSAGSLDTWELDQLAMLASRIEARTREDRSRQLFLGGFSFGGELAYHSVVHPDVLAQFGRRPVGLVLLSPALAVRPFSGGDGISRSRSLVHPGGATPAAPSPSVPLTNPLFAARVLVQGWQDRNLSPPHTLPIFVATADDARDTYVDVGKVHQRFVRLADDDMQIDAIACAGARHAVDNEAWPIGSDVVVASRAFVDGVLSAKPQPVSLATCKPYEHAFVAGTTR